jgi:hypothetical protein
MRALVGMIVITKGLVDSNSHDTHPAIITKVWSEGGDTRNGPFAVNVTVLPDMGPPQCFGSVMLFETKQEGVAHPGPRAWWPHNGEMCLG